MRSSAVADEVEQAAVLLVGELQVGVVCRATHGEDAEEAPGGDAEGDKVVLELRQGGVVLRIDAGDHIPQEVFLLRQQLDCLRGFLERLRMPTYPVVLLLEAFNAAGEKVHELRLPDMPLSATLDVSRWPSGTYILRLHTPQGVASKKLIVK